MINYWPRLIDRTLQNKLDLYGAVLLEGCKWCGKSTTAGQIAKSSLELQDSLVRKTALELVDTKPQALLDGEKPRLIDEWQVVPEIWDTVRHHLDKTGLTNQYIFTGSATPSKNKPLHSGIGRIVRLTMRPMSLYESRDSTGSISIQELFAGKKDIGKQSTLTLDDLAFLCARGGWPAAVISNNPDVTSIPRDYLEALVKNDIQTLDINSYHSEKMRTLIRSLARNIASPVSVSTIIKDTQNEQDESVAKNTVFTYLNVLEQLHIMDDVQAWSPKLRSKSQIRSIIKRNFIDPSLAVAALYAKPNDLLSDLRTFGLIFESLALRDLKIYMQAHGGDVLYYRDSYGLECDAILHYPDGRWAAVEIKLGSSNSIDEGAKTLSKLVATIDTNHMRPPKFLMILTAASPYAFRRKDDILVVPIGVLRD